MTIENAELNTSATLKESDTSYSGGSGDGNDPSLTALKAGYAKVADPAKVPHYLPQNTDDGENYVGDPFERGGFCDRPQGWQR
jgi:hypothetical protein